MILNYESSITYNFDNSHNILYKSEQKHTGKVFNPFKDAIFLQKIWSEKLNSEHKEKILLGRKVNLLAI